MVTFSLGPQYNVRVIFNLFQQLEVCCFFFLPSSRELGSDHKKLGLVVVWTNETNRQKGKTG